MSEKEKKLIERNAERCGLSVSECLRQRTLGYMPRAVLPEIFFSFSSKLDELCIACEGKISMDTEEKIIALIDDSQQTLQEAKQKVTDLSLLLRTLREMADITELTPTLVNLLIECIEVHNNDKSSSHCYMKVDIYFTTAGMIDILTGQEIFAMMEEIRENPREFRFVA